MDGDGGADAVAAELLQLTPRIGRVMRRFAAARLPELRLSMPQYRTLRSVRRRPWRMQELAERLMLSKQTVSQTVDVLVREGLVARTEDASDRRHTIVTPTDAGTRRLDAFEDEFVQYLSGALGGMPTAARQSAVEALRGLNALLVQRREEGYFKQPKRTAERTHE